MEFVLYLSVEIGTRHLVEKCPFVLLQPENIHKLQTLQLSIDEDRIGGFEGYFGRISMQIYLQRVYIDLFGCHKGYLFVREVTKVCIRRVEIQLSIVHHVTLLEQHQLVP